MNRALRFIGMFAVALLAGGTALAAPTAEPAVDPLAGVTINADRLDYNRDTELVTAEGNVKIEHGAMKLQADRVIVNRKTSVAEASGSVRLQRPDMVWEGDRLDYNLETREMKTDRFSSVFEPYHVWAAEGAKGTGMTYTLKSATFSTCSEPLDSLHYRMRARELVVVPNSYIQARQAVVFAGPVPVFYWPRMTRSLEKDAIGVEIQPGYQSRMGAYLLTGWSFEFTNWFSATTLLDYRQNRGAAAGEEFDWKTPAGAGKFHAYFLNDEGVDDDNNNYPVDRIPDASRYRFRLKQAEQFDLGWSAMGELNYLSDEFVLEDFYRRDFRQSPEPLNYALLSHLQDNQAFSVMGKGRLNDFYSTISRLPEVRHELFLTPLGDSGYYYEGYNDAVWLMQEPASFEEDTEDDETVDDVSLLRLDSRQFVTYPTSAGVFHLVPRAGVRATWYSKTRDEETVDEVVPNMATNVLSDGTTVVTDGVRSTVRAKEGGATLRPLFEVGSEASFKAFREWATGEEETLLRYRHIAEPYANYTLRPNVADQSPDDFYQMDEVDAYGSEHAVRLGMRNTIQFKRDSKIYELFDVDVYSTYYMESQQNDEGVGPFVANVESRPADEVYLRMNATYNIQDSLVEEWNLRGQFMPHEMWKITAEYRFRNELSSLANATVRYKPNGEWSYEVYSRYNLDDSRIEEHSYEVGRMLDCMGIRLGFTHEPGYTLEDGQEREDDYNVHVELWLTAFPGTRWGAGGGDR
jgi:lipopolysaccharide transport protein LptA